MADDNVEGAPVTNKKKDAAGEPVTVATVVVSEEARDALATASEKSVTSTISDSASSAAATASQTASAAGEKLSAAASQTAAAASEKLGATGETISQTATDAKQKMEEAYQRASSHTVVETAKETGEKAVDAVKGTAEWAKDKIVAGYETAKSAVTSNLPSMGGSELRANANIEGGETGKQVLEQTPAPDAEVELKKVKAGPDTPPVLSDKKPSKL